MLSVLGTGHFSLMRYSQAPVPVTFFFFFTDWYSLGIHMLVFNIISVFFNSCAQRGSGRRKGKRERGGRGGSDCRFRPRLCNTVPSTFHIPLLPEQLESLRPPKHQSVIPNANLSAAITYILSLSRILCLLLNLRFYHPKCEELPQ